MIAAVTEMIDDYDLGQLGERFVRYRLPAPSDSDTGMVSQLVWENLHDQTEIRARRSEVVAAFLAGLNIPDPLPDPREEEKARLSTLAELGAVCRSPVIRDRFKGDVIRSRGQRAWAGSSASWGSCWWPCGSSGWRSGTCGPLLGQIALDGMHPLRRRVLERAVANEGQMTTATFAARLDLPTTSVRRHLEDLAARGCWPRCTSRIRRRGWHRSGRGSIGWRS